MLSHLVPPRLLIVIALLATPLAAGCGGAPKTPVKVIGVSDAHGRDASRMLLFFLEVRNPTRRDIQLSQVDYELEAKPWFATTGRLQVARSIAAGGSAVIQVPVRLDDTGVGAGAASGVAYTFQGVLHVRAGSVDRDWPVRVNGELAHAGPDRSAQLVIVPIASRE